MKKVKKKEVSKYKVMMQRLGINMSDKSIKVWLNLMKEVLE